MKKTIYSLGVITLCSAAMLSFNSCNGSNETKEKTDVAVSDTSAVNAPIPNGAIVYVDMARIMNEYQMAIDLGNEAQTKNQNATAEITKKIESIQTEVTRKENNLTSAINKYTEKVQKGLYTQSTAETEAAKIQQQEIEFRNYVMEKENEINELNAKLSSELQQEMLVMQNRINDAVNTYAKKYNETKGYAMILVNYGDVEGDGATTIGTNILIADPALDITTDFLNGLNAEYKK